MYQCMPKYIDNATWWNIIIMYIGVLRSHISCVERHRMKCCACIYLLRIVYKRAACLMSWSAGSRSTVKRYYNSFRRPVSRNILTPEIKWPIVLSPVADSTALYAAHKSWQLLLMITLILIFIWSSPGSVGDRYAYLVPSSMATA